MNFIRMGNFEIRPDRIAAIDYTRRLAGVPRAWISFTGTFVKGEGVVLVGEEVKAFREWWQGQRSLNIIA